MAEEGRKIQPGDFLEAVEKTVLNFIGDNDFGVGYKHVEYIPRDIGHGPGIKITLNFSAFEEKIWQERLGAIVSEVSVSPSPIPLSDMGELTEIGERMKELRFVLRLKQGKFAKKIEISQGMLSDIEHGNKPLTDRNIRLICLTFNVNDDWLRTGKGEMFVKKPDLPPPEPPASVIIDGRTLEPDEEELIDIYRQLTPPNRIVAVKQIDVLLESQGGEGKGEGGRRADTSKDSG